MALAVPVFAFEVQYWLDVAVRLLAAVLLLWAFIHALTQSRHSFEALGGLRKEHWLGILAGVGLLGFLFAALNFVFVLYIAIGAATYYLLETRRGLREVSEGQW